MTDTELLKLAADAGFEAAILKTGEIPVDYGFRKYCEENLCGQYEANYSCPPTCGTPEEMHRRILGGARALVLKSVTPIANYQDYQTMDAGKKRHNQAQLALLEQLRALGYDGFMAGGSCCRICTPCRMKDGEECPFPEKRYSCMSAYCVDVAKTAEKAGMEFSWDETKLYSVGLIVLTKEA